MVCENYTIFLGFFKLLKNGIFFMAKLPYYFHSCKPQMWENEFAKLANDGRVSQDGLSEFCEQKDLQNRVSLGIYTKTHATLTPQGFETVRLVRYALLDAAQKLLPKERVKSCLRCRVDASKPVSVKYNQDRKQAHYDNLQRCGSVWCCPNCAPKITEQRKKEIKQAVERHTGGLYMLTLTIPHYMGDCLKSLLLGFRGALKRFFNGTRKAKAIWADMGKIGHIKALEVTWGQNGWHPHYHILIFTDKELPSDYDVSPLVELWQNSCRLAKLPIPNAKYGLDFRKGEYSEYVTKWGWNIESELTKGHLKKGRGSNWTAWDLLKYYAFGTGIDDFEKYGKLFQEFAICFKGSRQLDWSRGLKAMFGIGEKTDEQIAEETEKNAVEVFDICGDFWKLISKYKRKADFLHCVEYDQIHQTNTALELLEMLAIFEYNKILDGVGVRGVARPPPTATPATV